ncbi:MAG: DUF1579 domain-containing protein [Planctomycetes bacterium]|nr:DUF1579 domain-containing protein [Planctomycetota bacterium]
MLSRGILSLALVILVAGSLQAQEAPKPGPEHQKLHEMVGDWDTVMDVGGQKSKGKVTYKSICGGFWVASDFEADLFGTKFEGHGVDGYDVTKKKYVGLWVDSMITTPLTLEGDFDTKANQLVMTGTGPGPDGKPQKFRSTTEFKTKDLVIFKMYETPADGVEKLGFTIEYTRKKKPSTGN